MRTTRPNRRRSSASFWLGLMLIVLMAGGGLIGLLLLLGVNLNPFSVPGEDPYIVRIPVANQAIPAYERIAREHLLDLRKGGIMYQPVPPEATVGMSITGVTEDGSHVEGKVEDVRNVNDEVVFVVSGGREVHANQTIMLGGTLMSARAIIGRVLKKDKKAGMGFREAIFFPQGTPEGIAGATPPGMRAITLDATRLTGVHSLNAGDQIDLLANVPVEESGSFQANGSIPGTAFLSRDSSKNKKGSTTEPMLLTQGAIVLKPVYVRNEVTSSQSLTQGKRLQNVPKYEVAIAFAPDDIIPLQNALNRSLEITCIAHSMRPEDETNAPPPSQTVNEQLVPVTVRTILAYDVVGREAFVSPATRRLRMEPVSQQEIDRLGIITTLSDAVGSVTRRDIPAGHFLKRSDLLSGAIMPRTAEEPPVQVIEASAAADSSIQFVSKNAGDQATTRTVQSRSDREADNPTLDRGATSSPVLQRLTMLQNQATDPTPTPAPTTVGARPAITSFVPSGFTAFAIPWNRLYGGEHLQIGDQLDLLASFSLEEESTVEEVETRPDGTKITRKRQDIASRETMRTWEESFGMRGEPWFVASDAIVVGPVGFPAPAPALRALNEAVNGPAGGGNSTSLSGPPLMIAVNDRDVETVAAALSTQDVLFTVAFHPSNKILDTDPERKQIAIAAQDTAAYVQLTDTMWKGNRRRPLSRMVAAGDKQYEDALTMQEMQEYEFRVLRKAKVRGQFFTADDFLPKGAEPGIAAAARPGETIFAVADREIEGLDIFQAGDVVTILVRGIVQPPEGVVNRGVSLSRPVSGVIVPSARIVRATQGGQTILAVADADLTRLQAAWADSVSEENAGRRSTLLAVAPTRDEYQTAASQDFTNTRSRTDQNLVSRSALMPTAKMQSDNLPKAIPSFDPLGHMKLMEVIIGGKREHYVFAGDDASDSSGSGLPSYNFRGQ